MDDLHLLPKVRDSWGHLYVEHCKVEQEAKAIAIHDAAGRVPVPCAALSVIVPTRVGVNRSTTGIRRRRLDRPHARGGEPGSGGP